MSRGPDEQILAKTDEFFKLCRLGKYHPTEKRCPESNVKTGGVHHSGCDIEECQNCHLQLLSSGCAVDDE